MQNPRIEISISLSGSPNPLSLEPNYLASPKSLSYYTMFYLWNAISQRFWFLRKLVFWLHYIFRIRSWYDNRRLSLPVSYGNRINHLKPIQQSTHPPFYMIECDPCVGSYSLSGCHSFFSILFDGLWRVQVFVGEVMMFNAIPTLILFVQLI